MCESTRGLGNTSLCVLASAYPIVGFRCFARGSVLRESVCVLSQLQSELPWRNTCPVNEDVLFWCNVMNTLVGGRCTRLHLGLVAQPQPPQSVSQFRQQTAAAQTNGCGCGKPCPLLYTKTCCLTDQCIRPHSPSHYTDACLNSVSSFLIPSSRFRVNCSLTSADIGRRERPS